LYQQLEWLAFATDQFVVSLVEFVNIMSSEPTLKAQQIAKNQLTSDIKELASAINGLPEILRGMDPQLSIHQPEVTNRIWQYSFDRSLTFTELHRYLDLDNFAQRDLNDLRAILEQAKNNRTLIVKAIDDFRGFLAQEFPFKESF
jgi:hypothetical protein